ncbi:sugar phosphate isomerase/epimerase family protein [Gemmata sp. JC717]|uniref:sugar phosphate isomerase/epimerase family protein n=1 Tax=Gemmata algarum TaxID=2975278 RepID=UPI0021BB1ECE|nr:sugar phosphate isomerase/epimerase family protein [Gemmata algarum]MDY3551031.1 sugar phosphate isomerase/epimerase family protein [Gemmata algarum]
MLSRRQLLATAFAAAGGLHPRLAGAIDPIKRPGTKPDLKLSLAAYSFNKLLDLKKPSMDLFEFIDLAAGLPLDAVELTSYYWAETTDAYAERLKAHAAKKKLAISGVPVGNNFCVADETKYRAEIQKVKDWTARAAKVGAKTVRIFAGNLEKGDTLEAVQKRVVAAIEECCAVAEKYGVVLAMENHGGITATPDQLLALVKPVKSAALGVNIDTGNFKTADPYADLTKIAPYGVVSQVKTEVFPGGKREEADLARVVKILKDANFHGYVALEYEAKDDPKVAVPKYVKELRRLISG